MRKIFYISCLCILAFSCDSQKKIANAAKSSLDPNKTNSEKEKKGEIVHIGTEDFYKVNIADSTKNNNTISYGSIVSAKPKKYTITKTYFPSLGQGFRQRFIILHYTALDNEKSIRVLTQQSVSSHDLVSDLDDHEIFQLVDENKRAYHAGISSWKNSNNLNDSSIGIEIVNTGYVVDSLGKRQFQAFPEHQIEKIAVLVKDISKILKEVEIKIDRWDIIVLYSDWVTEAINKPTKDWKEMLFWEDRLMEAIQSAPEVPWEWYKTSISVYKNISIALSRFMWYKHTQLDDVTLWVIQYKPENYNPEKDFKKEIDDQFITEWKW